MPVAKQQNQNFTDITKKTTQSMGWIYLSFGLSKGLNLVTISILAHILPPEDFGIVALATLAIDYLSILNDLGLGAALIQRQKNVEEAANTTFTLNIIAGCVLTIITFVIAPYVSSFFRTPLVAPILRWLGLTFLIGAMGSTHNVRLQREMNFRHRIIPEIGNSLIKAIISISLALMGFGVWALVIGQLVGTLVLTSLLWIVYPWRPHLSLEPHLAKELFKYGISVMGVNAIAGLQDNFDYLLIGRFYNASALGIYTLAYRLPQLLVINLLWIMTAVLFPAFASVQDQVNTLKVGFLTVVRYVELIVIPICIGMFIAADPIIQTVFGEQWLGAIPILRILSIYALIISIGFHVGDIYKAIGRPDILLKIAIPVFLIRIIALWIGVQFSLTGVAIAHLVAGIIELAIRLTIALTILKITVFELLKELKAFVGGAVLALFALLALSLTEQYHPLTQLITVIFAGACGYLLTIWFIERDTLVDALQLVGIKRRISQP